MDACASAAEADALGADDARNYTIYCNQLATYARTVRAPAQGGAAKSNVSNLKKWRGTSRRKRKTIRRKKRDIQKHKRTRRKRRASRRKRRVSRKKRRTIKKR